VLVRRRVLILALVLIAAAAGAAGVIAAANSPQRSVSVQTRARATFPPDPEELAYLREVALRVAAETGDPHPTGGRVWASTRARANMLLSGDRVDTDQPTYMLVVEGDFVADNAPGPAGAPAPTGSVLTLVLDPSIGGVLDFGVLNSVPDLTALGPGADLGISG